MKNLSAIPRLSLLETFTILITLVVCLAGFTEAEVQTNYRKQDSNQQEENYRLKEASIKRNVPYAHQTSKKTENESEDRNVENLQNIPELPLEKLIKRHSDDYGESDESDDKESDGYGYDDDEYYHFNFKRNDETLENNKLEKEGVHDSNEKEGVSGQKSGLMNQNAKEKPKEIETIEMLNYKESHPSIDQNGNPTSMSNAKPYSEELNRKKLPSSSNMLGSLKMSDLRGTSSIDEKMKDRKDESGLSSEAKTSVKVLEDKDAVKLKDSKLTEDADQKEKETNLKDGKEAVVGKTIKEISKSSEEKEKSVKLSDSAKLEDNVEKIGGKAKENDSPKLTREDTADMTRFADKMSSDMINPSGLNQINNRASFVSSDYKENTDAMKTASIDEDEKTSEETNGMENNLALNDYPDELRRQEKFRKFYCERDVDENQNMGLLNPKDSAASMFRDSSKSKEYPQLALDLQNINTNEMFKKDWKNPGAEAVKLLTQQPLGQQNMQDLQQYLQIQQQLAQNSQMSQRQQDMNSDSRIKKNFGFSFQPSELENTEYHKNYLKYLKKYKGLNTDQKGLMYDTTGSLQAAYDDERNMKKKLQEKKVKKEVKRMEMTSEQKESAQSKHPKLRRNAHRDLLSTQSLRSSDTSQTLSKSANDAPKLTEGKKQEEQQEASRARRKSPLKLEYEIKVINQNSPDSKNADLSHITQRRFEKDLKAKQASAEKYLKKYPYSQVSRDDLTRLGESEGEKKFKRKASIRKRHDQKSVIHTRAVPSGYYGNRVKFGQKNYARNNERASSDSAVVDTGHVASSYFTSDSSPAGDKGKLQRSWEVRQQDYKHDPMKRYDESGHLNKGNTLFLVRKGQRTATTFEEGSPHQGSDSNLNPDSLAKILSRDKDYIVLKKTESNKFQKISEGRPNTMHMETGASNNPNKLSQEGDQRDFLKGSAKQTVKNKGLYVRSFRNDKDDKKFSSASHSSKSNLKKTFDKFRDLAGFFKDNEQESTDNQYSAQELKEGRDIVFSEDKLPDPIVISNDGSGKNMGFNQKEQNSIYSISRNFKTLDMQDKKNAVPTSNEADKNMFTAEAKSDNSDSSWGATLRSIFPEAKSINSMSKNGNEIIILDLNRNQLKTEHAFNMPSKMTPKSQQQFGTFGLTSQVPGSSGNSNENAIQVMLSPIQNKFQSSSKVPQKSPYSSNVRNNRAYAFVKAADNGNQVSIHNLADLPSLLRALSEKQAGTKMLAKRSLPRNADSQLSDNCKKFLTELNELSELNKSSYRKGKFAKKRATQEILLPSSSFPELSNYGDANIRYLGSLLQNIMNRENPEFKAAEGAQAESSDSGTPKTLEGSFKSGQTYLRSGVSEVDRNAKYQRRWSTAGEKNKDIMSLTKDKAESDSLRGKMGVSEDKNFQDEVLAELATASDKISRFRREGAKSRNLRKTNEDSSLRGKHESGTPSSSSETKLEDKCSKLESSSLLSKGETALGSEPNTDHDTKENSDKSFLKSDYENHLGEFFENLNSNKNPKDQLNVQNENTWKRKKRKENHRRKRSASQDVKNKVSTTAVQNTILKNLAEDNYQSVYSPGIKRRLFSTNNEADDADNYSNAYESDKNVIVEEAQPKCVKNSLNKCIDPMIVELFGALDKEEEKNRARRSLTSGFHSNFKREIDLDESMPNDFQNFLVTSLGGFGSQNREVIKKDVALWERKESTQDAKQITESSPPGGKEDPNSTLEKREVPSSENSKSQSYFPSRASSDLENAMGSLNHVEKQIRSDNKAKLKSKSQFADEKLPTQIRIQITNASSKEKKSSKPIMDESETTTTETENLPKEKEFFDKNKISTLRLNNLPKLRNPSKNKFPFSDYEENDNSEDSSSQITYHPRRRRRKKKKYASENPMKPIRDFIKFDQKTMETFLRKIISDQNLATDQKSIQKGPVSNHLPQVETVYNPTQGTNKAQLEVSRFGKMNSASNKNTGTVKNNMQSTDTIGYDEGILRNYLKDKNDKMKEFEDIDWKPRYGKMRLRQEFGWGPSSSGSLKAPADTSSYSMSTDPNSYMNPFNQHLYGQKIQTPSSNYFFHPSSTNSENANSLYDTLKFKQEIKNQNTLSDDHSTSKIFKMPYYYNNGGVFKSDDKERNPNPLFPSLNAGDGSWNYEYSLNKNPAAHGFKGRDFFSSGIKNQNHLDSKTKIAHGGSRKFMKNLEDEKSSVLDNPQSSSLLDNTKDTDYLDNLGADDDYLDDDSGKESQAEEQLMSVPLKYHRMFNSDTDDNMSEDDEEVDEDYDENSEEDDPDDYSLLANTKAMDPELTNSGPKKTKFQGSFNYDSSLSPFNYVYPKDNLLQLRGHGFEHSEFTNSKNDMKFSQGRQPLGLFDMKNDLGSLSSSTGLLRKANENSNIFGKNLLKSTYGYNSENGLSNHLPENKMKDLNALYYNNKLFKRKMDSKGKFKRSREMPQIGSRLFYAAKTEINDDPEPSTFLKQIQRKARNDKYSCCRRNPFNAEFADPDNSFDDSEENDNDNLLNFGKNLQEEEDEDNDDQDEEPDFEDVAENLEDDGETISKDNILENVIGKYIMRKRVASSEDLNRPESSEVDGKHKLEKRSPGQQKTHDVKIVKRLSSGHLTESNFRKYHKKNFTRKREVKEYDFDSHGKVADGKTTLMKARKRENTSHKKRSALDLFKKITNKDRDNKKVENVDGRTAGFEPLSSLSGKKYESSTRDNKFDFFNQMKKIANEGSQSQIKSSVVELKQHLPHEGLLTGNQRTKEKFRIMIADNPSTIGQGPLKIELNNKHDVKLGDFSENVDNLKEAVPPRQDNRNLKAFLVFSKDLNALKISPAEDLSPGSGSSQKEVGNSYRPKSDEGRRISKMHVSKRSLDSSVVTNIDKEAADSSRNHFISEQSTETHVNIEEKNRALHDTMSLSEGDSKPQPPHVLQRNTKHIRSFVTDDEQCPNSRSPPSGSTNNRTPVFPPSNEENIMRDGRQVNEEASKYLGQQIVDAILSHVSANPKFKELIAPGLAVRTTTDREDVDITTKPLHQADTSDQLHFYLQKVMLDLEKLAENHVRKRMCTQIDEQSKEFLQSLLNVPENTHNNDNVNSEVIEDYLELDSTDEQPTTAMTEAPKAEALPTHSQIQISTEELENLRRKHSLLLKLIDDFEKLTKLEKDSLRGDYRYLLQELEHTNKQLESLSPVADSEVCSRRYHKLSSDKSRIVSDFENRVSENSGTTLNCPNCTSCPRSKPPSQGWQWNGQPSGPSKPKPNNEPAATADEQKTKPNILPTFSFEEELGQSQETDKTTPTPIFETVDSMNITDSNQMNKMKILKHNLKESDSALHPSPAPQTFDLLPRTNSTEKINSVPFDVIPGTSESIPLQQSLSGIHNFEKFDNPVAFQDSKRQTELHKLSIGDAAGLQLSLKYRGPWVSNLDVAKTIRNVPLPLAESSGLDQLPKPELRESFSASKPDTATIDSPSVADLKDSESLFAPNTDYSSFENPILRKNSLTLGFFPNLNLGMFIPKNRPFESVSNGALRNGRIRTQYFLRKYSANGKKRVFLRSNVPPLPSRISNRVPKDYPQLVKVFPRSQKVFTQSEDVLPQSAYVVFPSPEVSTQTPNNVQSGGMLIRTPDTMIQSPDVQTQSPEMAFQPSDDMVQSQNIQTNSRDNSVQSSATMTQASDVPAQSPEFSFQPFDTMMQSTNVQVQPPDMMYQPSDVKVDAPNTKTKSPDISFQPFDTMMPSRNDQEQPPDTMFQPSNVKVDAPDAKTESPEISFQPFDTMMQSTNVQAQPSDMMFQPSDVKMDAPNAKTESPEISFQPFDTMMPSRNYQPPDMMYQPSDVKMDAPNAKTKSPEITFQPFDTMMSSKNDQPPDMMYQPSDVKMDAPNDKTKSPEIMFQPFDTMMQSTNVQAQPPDMMFQPSDVKMDAPNAKTKSPDISFQPFDTMMPSRNDQPPDMMFQPSDVKVDAPNAKTKSPDLPFQPSNNMMSSKNVQSPTIIFQPSDVKVDAPDAKTKSPDISFQPFDTMMPSKNDQEQPPGQMYQTSDVKMDAPNAKTKSPDMFQPSNNMMSSKNGQLPTMVFEASDVKTDAPDTKTKSPEISFQPSNNMTSSKNVMMQPSNGMMQPPGTTVQFPEFETQPSDVSMQSQHSPVQHLNVSNRLPNIIAVPLNISMEPTSVQKETPNAQVQSPKTFKQPTDDHSQSVNESHPLRPPPRPPDVLEAKSSTQPPCHVLEYPGEKTPPDVQDFCKKHQGHHKKHRLFSHFPLPCERRNKHKNRNKSKKSLNTKNSDETDDEAEYLAWSNMPAVRRQLNKLEAGLELDDFFWKNPKLRKVSKEGEDSLL